MNTITNDKISIIKVPYSEAGLGRTKGTELAPDKILEELKDFYLKEKSISSKKHDMDLSIEAESKYFDIDEVQTLKGNIEYTNEQISKKVKEKSGKVIVLGGDHNTTYGAFSGFLEREDIKGKDVGLIFLDAHPDVLPSTGLSSHEDLLRQLIEEKKLNPKNIIMFGIRNVDVTEKAFLDKHGIEIITMKTIFENGVHALTDSLMSFISRKDAIYLSIDIDVVDPSAAPGTGYLEPGGISARELIYIVQRLSFLENLKQIDIVEVNPDLDINNMTSRLAAKVLKECW